MKVVRRRWKNFKSTLTREYIRGPKRDQDPCLQWTYLDPEEWKKFYASRLDPKFQEISKKQQERQKLNVFPHTMSRGGYLLVEEKITREQLKAMEEASQADPSIVLQPPPPITRHRKWAEGRKHKGKYINAQVEEIVRRIDELEEQNSQGSFSQIGRMDILATAIRKPDGPGRVRGEYGSVGLTQFFGRSRRNVQADLSEELVEKIREKIREEMMEQIRGEMRTMVSNIQQVGVAPPQNESPVFLSTKNSFTRPVGVDVHNHDPPGPNSADKGEPCFLHMDVPNLRAVAKATRYPRASIIHNMNIPEDQVKVSVISFGEGEAATEVPFPIEGVAKLGEAVGSFILWPKHLVFDTAIAASSNNLHKYASLAVLRNFVPSLPKNINLKMAPGVVGPDKAYTFGFVPSDVVAFLSMHDLEHRWLELAIQ